MRNCGAIVLAAGKGTRMKSERAKVVFQMAEKPLVERVVNTAISMNCNKIGVVVGYRKEEVMNALPENDKITFVEQIEQNGTGHAVLMARELFENYEGDLFILCGDVPLLSKNTLDKLLQTHREQNAACTVLTAVLEDAGTYGRIVRSPEGKVLRIVEFKDASEQEREIGEFNTGIYCFDAKLLFTALGKIGKDNKQGEYYLTDTLEILNDMGKVVSAVITDDLDEVSGINSQKELAHLEMNHYRKVKNHWLANGVIIENPESVIIGEDVEIENDAEIGANTIIKGKSKIGFGAIIGPNSYLEDAVINKLAHLKGYNVVVRSTVEESSVLEFKETKINV
ncbi:MAG: sugar phosphate nucleotidyltransferase [Candidatus Cloacimonadia bacterium]